MRTVPTFLDKNDGDSVSVNESTNPLSSSKTGVTSWIEIRNIGNKNANYTILYPFNNDANKFCVEEMTNDTGLLTPHMPNNTETKGDT